MRILTAIALFLLMQVNPAHSENLPVPDLKEAERILGIFYGSADRPVAAFSPDQKQKNKKIIAALLAFPFPCGIVGLHRIYLGCAPHVPVAYIATVGGGFGLLPLIDFIFLLKTKDLEPYIANDKVFMWGE